MLNIVGWFEFWKFLLEHLGIERNNHFWPGKVGCDSRGHNSELALAASIN